MSLDNLLSRLSKVRKNGNDYVACCPAHDDKTPSMAISEKDDGIILIHCFAGCSVDEILGAIGLEFHDIMPDNVGFHRRKPEKVPFNSRDVLTCVRFESGLVALAAFNIANGIEMLPADKERLLLAAQRLNEAAELAGI
jgi:hypothetical protein